MYLGNPTTSVKKWLGWWVSVARANNILLLKGTVQLQEMVRDAFLAVREIITIFGHYFTPKKPFQTKMICLKQKNIPNF